MAEKKSQHYVPQFHLRLFSSPKSPNRISLYHIPSNRFVPVASLKNQACANNFYGSIDIENSLEKIEAAASKLIKKIVVKGEVPKWQSEERLVLLVYTLFQAYRTKWAAEAQVESVEKFTKTLASHQPQLAPYVDSFKISIDNPAAEALHLVATSFYFAIDLRFKVLRNETSQPFILSDHPAVLYNQFLENRKLFGSNLGIATKGLQIFLPLDPAHCIVFFDGDVYQVGGRRLSHMMEKIDEVADVESLNMLQAANANEHLYFGDGVSEAAVKAFVRLAEKYRRAVKAVVNEYPSSDAQGALMHLYHEDLRTGLKLQVIRTIPTARTYRIEGRVIHPRNPVLHRAHDEFLKQVEAGAYTPGQFLDFLQNLVQAGSGGSVDESRPRG
jgi:hypothetical protein